MPGQGSDAKRADKGMYFGQVHDKQGVQTTKDMLGEDTFDKPDRRGSIWPDISEGAGALRMMEQGRNPGEIVSAYRGGPKGDINLPAAPKRPVAKKATRTKSLSKGRR